MLDPGVNGLCSSVGLMEEAFPVDEHRVSRHSRYELRPELTLVDRETWPAKPSMLIKVNLESGALLIPFPTKWLQNTAAP